MAREQDRAIEILVRADVQPSIEQIYKDINDIQKAISTSNKEINIAARVKKIHIDKAAVAGAAQEINKMFRVLTVDITGKVIGLDGSGAIIRKQADDVQKAVSAAAKKLSNIEIDYGSGMDGMEKGRLESFRKEIERLKNDINAAAPDVTELSDRMDVFAHSLLANKKAMAENAAQVEAWAKACRGADKAALDIEQNYLGKANDSQRAEYKSLTESLAQKRGLPGTSTSEIDAITDSLSVLKNGIIETSRASDKAKKDAADHVAAIGKSLDAARKSLDAVKSGKNWGYATEAQKKEYTELTNKIVQLRGVQGTTEESVASLMRRITALGNSVKKTASDTEAAAKESKEAAAAYREFSRAAADLERLDTTGLTDDQLADYRELLELIKRIRQNPGSETSGALKEYTNQIRINKADVSKMLANLKKVQAEAKKTQTALAGMGKKLGGFEEKFGLDLNEADLATLENFKKQIKDLKQAGHPASESVKELVDSIDAFINRIQTGENRVSTMSGYINDFLHQMERISAVGGDLQGVDLSSIKSIEAAFISLRDIIDTHSDAIEGDVNQMALEIFAAFNQTGKIDLSKLRLILSSIDLSKISGNEEYSAAVFRLQKLAESAEEAGNEVADLFRIMSDDARTQRFQNQIDATSRKLETFYSKYSKVRNNKGFSDEYESLMKRVSYGMTDEEAKKWINDIDDFIFRAKQAGLASDTFGEKIQKAFQKFGGWAIISGTMMRVVQTIKDMINNVVELDSCLTELKKVTDETSSSYDRFMQRTKAAAKEIGSTVTDLVTATAEWAKLGYSLTDAEELAKISTIYANVGEDIESIDDATANLVSTIQGFKDLDASDAMNVVDILNEISNKFPASSGGLGEALRRSSAALSAAGNSLEESVALITAADAVLQDPSSTGTMMKTVSMYLRATKTELEEAGESTEGMANSVSELRSELLALTDQRVDILNPDEQSYKSTYEILKEISNVWNDLGDMTQANILNLLAGKRNANAVSAILENFEMAEAALAAAGDAAGSASAEHAKWLTSIEGKINQFKASFESLSSSVVNSDFLRFLIDGATVFITLLDAITQKIGPIPGLMMGITTAMQVGGFGLFDYKVDTDGTIFDDGLWRAAIGHTEKYQKATSGLKAYFKLWDGNKFIGTADDLEKIAKVFDKIDDEMAESIRSGKKLDGNVKDLTNGYKEQGKAMAAAAAKAALLDAALNTGLSLAIWGITKGLVALYDALTISAEEMNDAATAAGNLGDSLSENIGYADKLKALEEQLKSTNLTLEEENSIHEQMLGIQDAIIEKYGAEAAAIDIVNDGIRETLGLLEQKNAEEFNDWYDEVRRTNLAGDSTLNKAINAYDSFQYNEAIVPLAEYKNFLHVLNEDQKKLFEDFFTVSKTYTASHGGAFSEKETLYIDVEMNADEAEAYLDSLIDIVDSFNKNGDYDKLFNFLSDASSKANGIISGSEKTTATYYYDNIVKYNEGIKEYYNAVVEAEEAYSELLKTGSGEEIEKQYGVLTSSIQTFIANIRASSIESAEETAVYYTKKYDDILSSYRSKHTGSLLGAVDSDLTSDTVAALHGLAKAGYYTAGQIKSAFRAMKDSGVEQFGQITDAIELSDEELEYYQKQITETAAKMNELTNGNVNYHERPVLSAEAMWSAGYGEFPSSDQATTYTLGKDVLNADGIPFAVEFTPILENGEVLSEEALEEYIADTLSGKFTDIGELLALDSKKLVFHVMEGSHDQNKAAFDALHEELTYFKTAHLDAYNALNGYLTEAEGFAHIQELADDLGKTFEETVDYLEELGYFGKEFSSSAVSSAASDIIHKYADVMDVLNRARREQESFGYVTTETVSDIYALSGSYEDISDVIEYNGEQYVFAADKANSFAQAQRKAGEQSLREAGAITEDILALNEYYNSLSLTSTQIKEFTQKAFDIYEVQEKIKESTGFTATELETLREEYGELPAKLNETTGLFELEATAIQDLNIQFEELISKIITLRTEASKDFGLTTLASQLGADVNSYKVQKTYEGIMNRIRDHQITSTEEYLAGAADAVIYKDILDNYFSTLDEVALWQGLLNHEVDMTKSIGDGTGSTTKNTTDKWKEAFDAKYAMMKHELGMERISNETFLNWLDGAYREYFSDLTKYQNEYNQYEKEVFDGRRSLIDDHISDLEKEYEYLGDEAKVIESLNSLLAEKRRLMSEEQISDVNAKILEYQEKGYRKQIDLIEDQISLLDEKENSEEETVECYKRMVNLLYDVKNIYSDIYDESSDLMRSINAEIEDVYTKIREIEREVWEKQRDAPTEALEKEQDSIEDYQQAIEDILDATVEHIKRQKEDEIEAIEKTKEAREEYYDSLIENIEESSKVQKEALEDELDGYRKIIDAKKEALQEEAEEEDYAAEVEKRAKEISDLQSKIDVLSLDDSKSAAAERLELESELAQKQEELRKYQRDHALDKQLDALDEEFEAFEEVNKQKVESIEDANEETIKILEERKEAELKQYDDEIAALRNYLEKEGVLWQDANDLIRAQGQTLWNELRAYAAEYTRDVEKLADAWDLVCEAMSKANSSDLLEVDEILSQKHSQNETEIEDLKNSEYNGKFTEAQRFEIETIRAQMKSNSQAWHDANNAGNIAERDYLADQNQKLKERLNTSLGYEALKYDEKSGVWYFDGMPFYKMKIYHTGGIAGDHGSLKQNELLAILKNREMVLTEPMQETMSKYIHFAKNASAAISSILSSDPVKNIVAGLSSGRKFAAESPASIHIDKLFDFHADTISKDSIPEVESMLKRASDYTIRQMEDRLSRRGIKTKSTI